jgi:hypothetical protein
LSGPQTRHQGPRPRPRPAEPVQSARGGVRSGRDDDARTRPPSRRPGPHPGKTQHTGTKPVRAQQQRPQASARRAASRLDAVATRSRPGPWQRGRPDQPSDRNDRLPDRPRRHPMGDHPGA